MKLNPFFFGEVSKLLILDYQSVYYKINIYYLMVKEYSSIIFINRVFLKEILKKEFKFQISNFNNFLREKKKHNIYNL